MSMDTLAEHGHYLCRTKDNKYPKQFLYTNCEQIFESPYIEVGQI